MGQATVQADDGAALQLSPDLSMLLLIWRAEGFDGDLLCRALGVTAPALADWAPDEPGSGAALPSGVLAEELGTLLRAAEAGPERVAGLGELALEPGWFAARARAELATLHAFLVAHPGAVRLLYV